MPTERPCPMDVRIDHDRHGRSVAVIPDDFARELRAAAFSDWTEIPDMAEGYSRYYTAGDRAWELAQDFHHTLDALHEADPASPRQPTFTVGTSGWDFTTHWWAQPYVQDAHVPTIWTHPNGSIRFTG